jgi:hypothetical protein
MKDHQKSRKVLKTIQKVQSMRFYSDSLQILEYLHGIECNQHLHTHDRHYITCLVTCLTTCLLATLYDPYYMIVVKVVCHQSVSHNLMLNRSLPLSVIGWTYIEKPRSAWANLSLFTRLVNRCFSNSLSYYDVLPDTVFMAMGFAENSLRV